ncbi:MAG: prepilin-type N-terminal cleavage/methylation domain-containing protein [Pontiellaceae bacterium]|jgi:prepilin-type N-terminal cleavage/methylation domain-containing protein|nr:prepilin-type N-terminal cleavage/methylation domain-containing protein [Pontiellaceae bacterium]
MKKNRQNAGVTLVEVMMAMFLVSIAAIIIYTEMMLSYRILMRSRARLEAQSIAFDRLWEIYNRPLDDMPIITTNFPPEPTPAWSSMSTGGVVDCLIFSETNAPVLPDPVHYWDITVTVWPPTNTMLEIGDQPLASYAVRRYRGVR